MAIWRDDEDPVTFEPMHRTPRRDLRHRWQRADRGINRRFRKECDRKVAHTSRKTAEAERVRLAALSRKRFTVYRCRFCGAYHCGHAMTRHIRAGLVE